MARAPWPAPPPGGCTLWHITDTHVDSAEVTWAYPRMNEAGDDIQSGVLGEIDGFLHTGDLIDDGTTDEDPQALTWLSTYFSAKPNIVVPGNHDLKNGRTPAQWESIYGRPASRTATIVGSGANQMLIVGVAPDTTWTSGQPGDPWVLSATTISFMDTQLQRGLPTWVACHYMLAEQDGRDPATAVAQPHDQIAQLISDYPNFVGWLCGHQHWPTWDARCVQAIAIGNRTAMPAISGPSTAFRPDLGRTSSPQGPYRSLFVTYLGDRVEVRYRDHGARRWAEGEGGARVSVLPL